MRNPGFVTVHRGGTLIPEHHRLLMAWAQECFVPLLHLYPTQLPEPLAHALEIAEAWRKGEASTGDAMTASRRAHACAKMLEDPLSVLLARAIGQMVAVAHMADHCLGPVWYGWKALKLSQTSLDTRDAYRTQVITLLEAFPEPLPGLLRDQMSKKHIRLDT